MFIESSDIASSVTNAQGLIFDAFFDVFSGSVAGVANQFDALLTESATLQSLGNFEIILNPFFPPDSFKFYFGNNATQNISNLVIHKNELFGLTPSINNTAESLIVGIINRLLGGNLACEFPKLSSKYWGYGVDSNKRIDTINLDIRNILPTSSNEIAEYTDIVNPNQY